MKVKIWGDPDFSGLKMNVELPHSPCAVVGVVLVFTLKESGRAWEALLDFLGERQKELEPLGTVLDIEMTGDDLHAVLNFNVENYLLKEI
jgi:hypothetical protein